jgi:hypothetical protein
MPTELDRFVEFILSKENCDYVWPDPSNNYSGKDLKIAKYKNVYDCSGLVTSALYSATGGKLDWRSAKNAQALFDACEPLKSKPKDKPCLAFYGPGKNAINHVMVVFPDGRAYGACSGGRWCLTPEIAKAKGARVRFRASHRYRDDFRGFAAIPLPTKE